MSQRQESREQREQESGWDRYEKISFAKQIENATNFGRCGPMFFWR